MILIVGLGNPGKKYEGTRHNIGKEIVKKIALIFDFPKFKINKNLKAETTKTIIDGHEIILALPTTYMNESGQAVKLLATGIEQPESNLWVVHDDIDLPLGKIRICKNHSAAGHKGVQSIINNLGTQNFVRFRFGIHPQINADINVSQRKSAIKANKVSVYVLQKFNKNEQKAVKKNIRLATEILEFAIKNGVEKAMNKYN